MAGSITTLGVGSNLELQSILDQLRDTEQAPIKAKETKKLALKKELEAYNSLNTKLFSMKSKALSLSLESDFLQTEASVSDEDILTAKVDDGIAVSSHNIEVVKKAQYSSWQTAGVKDTNAVVYQAPKTGISSPSQKAVDQNGTIHIKYGSSESQKSINVNVKAGMNLTQVIDAINSSGGNKDIEGNPLVKASMKKNGDNFYIHLEAAGGVNTADAQLALDPPVDYIGADTAISIQLAKNAKPSFVKVQPGTTYAQLAQKVNDEQIGVNAKIVDTGMGDSPFRLTITSNESGEDNEITIKSSNPDFMTQVTGGANESLNSEFKVNGITYQRQSNENISDVISGVTLNLKKVGESSIGISKDTAPIKKNIMELVKGFNELLGQVHDSEETSTDDKDAKKNDDNANPLADSFEAKAILSKLRELITTSLPNTGSGFKGLSDLGLEINKDGTMALNEDVLDQKLASDPEKIARLFIGDDEQKIKGLGDIINDGLKDMVSFNGLVTTEIDIIETKMESLTQNIKKSNEMLDKRYKSLTAEFVRLDIFISQTNRESSLMTSMIDSFNKTMEK